MPTPFGGRGQQQSPEESGFGPIELPGSELRAPEEFRIQFERSLTTGTNEEICLLAAELAFGLAYELKFNEAQKVLGVSDQYAQATLHQRGASPGYLWHQMMSAQLALMSGADLRGCEVQGQIEYALGHPLTLADCKTDWIFDPEDRRQSEAPVAMSLVRYQTLTCLLLKANDSSELQRLLQAVDGVSENFPNALDRSLTSILIAFCQYRLSRRSSSEHDQLIERAHDNSLRAIALLGESGFSRLLGDAYGAAARFQFMTGRNRRALKYRTVLREHAERHAQPYYLQFADVFDAAVHASELDGALAKDLLRKSLIQEEPDGSFSIRPCDIRLRKLVREIHVHLRLGHPRFVDDPFEERE